MLCTKKFRTELETTYRTITTMLTYDKHLFGAEENRTVAEEATVFSDSSYSYCCSSPEITNMKAKILTSGFRYRCRHATDPSIFVINKLVEKFAKG